MPSTRPVSKPSAPRRCWSSATSSPAQHGVRRYRKRPPRLVARLDQGVPGLATADAVDPQAPPVLEGLDGGPGGVPERPVGVGRRCRSPSAPRRRWTSVDRPAGGRPRPAAGPRRDRGTAGDRRCYRYADSSWSSWPLGLAPISRAFGSPSLNRIRVGMLITSKRRVTSRLSSMFSLPICELARLLLGDLLEHRGDHLARAAPFGPEVHQDRDVGGLDMLVKGSVVQGHDLLAHGVSSLGAGSPRPSVHCQHRPAAGVPDPADQAAAVRTPGPPASARRRWRPCSPTRRP